MRTADLMPAALRAARVELFGDDVGDVVLVEHSV
jgi:hypothetical protein